MQYFFNRLLMLSVFWVLFASAVQAVGLPDTGQDVCYNDTGADTVPAASSSSIARDNGTHPRQDCMYGRDAAVAVGALTKIGGGAKGLDYSKIANNGSVLPATAALGTATSDWGCTRDNITGLTWEVKTTSGLRSMNNTYSWYSSNSATNAGNAGTANGGSCSGGSGCDTEKFVVDVNAAQLCSYSDWRMPTLRELQTLTLDDGSNPAIDITYFPNTVASFFWSGSSYFANPANAWYVYFNGGGSSASDKSVSNCVRLVRGGQF